MFQKYTPVPCVYCGKEVLLPEGQLAISIFNYPASHEECVPKPSGSGHEMVLRYVTSSGVDTASAASLGFEQLTYHWEERIDGEPLDRGPGQGAEPRTYKRRELPK